MAPLNSEMLTFSVRTALSLFSLSLLVIWLWACTTVNVHTHCVVFRAPLDKYAVGDRGKHRVRGERKLFRLDLQGDAHLLHLMYTGKWFRQGHVIWAHGHSMWPVRVTCSWGEGRKGNTHLMQLYPSHTFMYIHMCYILYTLIDETWYRLKCVLHTTWLCTHVRY